MLSRGKCPLEWWALRAGSGGVGVPEEPVEVGARDGGGLVDDEDGAGVEGGGGRVFVGQMPSQGLGGDAGGRAEGAGRLALHSRPEDLAAGLRPRS